MKHSRTAAICIVLFSLACACTRQETPAVESVSADDRAADPKAAGAEKYKYVNAETGLRLRNGRDVSSVVLQLIPFGERVQVLETTADEVTIDGVRGAWCRIDWNGKTGWAFGGFLAEQVEITPEFVRSQITVFGAVRITDYKIPDILNHVTGFDEEPPASSDKNACLVDSGFSTAILLAKNKTAVKDLTLEARAGSHVFTQAISADSVDKNNEGRYYFYLHFENKYWLDATVWRFTVREGTNILFTGDKEFPPSTPIYVKRNDNPFVFCGAHDFTRGIRYTYDEPTDGDSIVVFYFSRNWELYRPVLVLRAPKTAPGKNFIFTFQFKELLPAGVFCIRQYPLTRLPVAEGKQLVFDSYQVQ
jgi:hypothetical protein